jgi:monoamine oxidase
MPRTPLASRLQEIAAEVAAEDDSKRATRRQVLAGGAGLAAAAALSRVPSARAAGNPRIAIVGAGLAGLSCAYDLKRAGYTAQVYEGSDRIGGRCWTIRGEFAGGQIAEHGGELIDQGHTAIRNLAQGLGLNLDNLLAAEANGTEALYYFDGQPYTVAEATDDLKAIWQQIHMDVSAASYPTLYNLSTERGRELDRMSIADWVAAYVPGGRSSKLGKLLEISFNIEYGAEPEVQSSLNMLYLIGYQGPGNLRLFGKSNEKYRVSGGNDQIPARLADALAGQITTGRALSAISRKADGTYTLNFSSGPAVTADRVVMAIPFAILRGLNYSKAGFSDRKVTAIKEQGMGTNSKLHVQFSNRHWRTLDCNGETYADTGYQNTWEVTRAQAGTPGILVDYTGGTIGNSFGSGTPASRAQQFLTQIEPLLPGLSAKWNGRATVDYWAGNPWTKGSYSYWKVGQYQRFAGVEREIEGACHFAGEHTSVDFQGYLNGAVETGQRAAGEIIGALR